MHKGLMVFLLVAGCARDPLPLPSDDGSGSADMAYAADLVRPSDLATTDLMLPPDMTTPPDLAPPCHVAQHPQNNCCALLCCPVGSFCNGVANPVRCEPNMQQDRPNCMPLGGLCRGSVDCCFRDALWNYPGGVFCSGFGICTGDSGPQLAGPPTNQACGLP